MKNPCHNCQKRYPGCHASCEDYKSWKSQWDEMRERERKRKAALAQSPKPRLRKPYHAPRIRGDQ